MIILQLYRFIGVFFFISLFFLSAPFVYFLQRNRWKRNKGLIGLTKLYSKGILYVLGVKVTSNLKDVDIKENGLLVGNHLSYLDVMTTVSQIQSSYVTSVEMKETPALGHICMLAGCLFVERRNRRNLSNEIKDITDGLTNGSNVTIFPEATSTNGDTVIRFRRPLFQAAIDADKPVYPFVMNYKKIGNKPFSLENRDYVCWYGDMGFLGHFWKLCSVGRIEVEFTYFDNCKLPEDDCGSVALNAHQIVLNAYQPPLGIE